MPTPRQGYRTKDGARIPSVTTIISKFKESGGLVHWAWDLGIQGLDYRKVRDEAASSGTFAHAMVEAWIKGEDPEQVDGPDELIMKARNAYMLFLEWAGQTKLKVTDTEVGLVSEKYRFGGTLDAMLISDRLSLGDWKTSNHVYADYLFQLAAYAILWEENRPDQLITGGFHLMRFAKDTPDFSHHYWGELEEAKEGFLLMRRLYDIKATLDKRAA